MNSQPGESVIFRRPSTLIHKENSMYDLMTVFWVTFDFINFTFIRKSQSPFIVASMIEIQFISSFAFAFEFVNVWDYLENWMIEWLSKILKNWINYPNTINPPLTTSLVARFPHSLNVLREKRKKFSQLRAG